LELPGSNPVFDYASIADAIVELSFTAADDGLLRQAVEGRVDSPGTIDARLASGMVRILSLRHDLPDAFHRVLAQDAGQGGEVEISLDRTRLLPYWVGNRQIELEPLDIFLEPESGHTIAIDELQGDGVVLVNGEPLATWIEPEWLGHLPMASSSTPLAFEDDMVSLSLEMSLPDSVEIRDILLRLRYRASP
jgi:hypothetical protein